MTLTSCMQQNIPLPKVACFVEMTDLTVYFRLFYQGSYGINEKTESEVILLVYSFPRHAALLGKTQP